MSEELVQETIEVINDLLYECRHSRRISKEVFMTIDAVKTAYDLIDKLFKE
jgi:hypothetical protein